MSPAITESPSVAAHAPPTTRTPVGVHLAVGLTVVIALGAVLLQPWLPASDLLRDSQDVAARHGSSHAAYGLISNLGILMMAAASGAALIGWIVLGGRTSALRSLLAWSAVLGLAFVLDDLLLLHETAAFLPGASIAIAAVYGLAFFRYLWRFRTTIRRELDAGPLAVAVVALAVSALVDVVIDPTEWSVFIEDGAKLLGVVAWSAFVVRATLVALNRVRPHRRIVALN